MCITMEEYQVCMTIRFWLYQLVIDKFPFSSITTQRVRWAISAAGTEKLSHVMSKRSSGIIGPVTRQATDNEPCLMESWPLHIILWMLSLILIRRNNKTTKSGSCARMYACPSLIPVVCLKHPFASMATIIANTPCPKQQYQIFNLSLAPLSVPYS